ncbi:MAG: cytochrome c [Acidimicrobiia bacterium]|nr:cytochrome c [Acidimicrobiia bacterium]
MATLSLPRRPGLPALCAAVLLLPWPASAEVTFTKDIAPLLQNHCERCHRPGSIAPMSLVTYEEVRPYARAIRVRTSLRDKPGVMPPWMLEKNVGIQGFQDDPSLSDAQIAMIAEWVDNGAPRGNPDDMPPPLTWRGPNEWAIGEPDLIVKSKPFSMEAEAPDWWGSFDNVLTGLTEDRYVAAYEFHEVNDARGKEAEVTGGAAFTAALGVIHHGTVTALGPDGRPEPGGCCPTHEVGRNADWFDPRAGKPLRAGSSLAFNSMHLHANGRDTTGHIEIGFKFHPRGYVPAYKATGVMVATNHHLIDIPAGAKNLRVTGTGVLRENTKLTVFEPHMHAAGVRFCLEAIYGTTTETLNCAGYDHSWVLAYTYQPDTAPLLPKGTILRVVGYYDNTPANKNVVDPRNWQGGGHRSVDNMNLILGQGIAMTDAEFEAAVAERRGKLGVTGRQVVIGCPTCGVPPAPPRQQSRLAE